MNRPFLGVNKHPLEAGEAGEVGGVLICVGHFGNLLSFEPVDDTKSNKMERQWMLKSKNVKIDAKNVKKH